MGQRLVQLESTYTGFQNNTGILHVSQVPPNPAILAPGPALIFVVVNGVPSVGAQVMIGSGKLGTQQRLPIGDLPASAIVQNLGAADNAKNAGSSLRISQHWLYAGVWGIFIGAVLLGW
jgi:hypothetical protein